MLIYLDNAATTKIDPRVFAKMKDFYFNHYGNASSIHFLGQANDLKIAECKEKVAKIFNSQPENIVFTGSATEANNFIIKGVMRANKNKGNHLIVSNIEHPCVMNSARELVAEGFELDFAPVDSKGLIKLDELAKLIRPTTVLVSIMAVNNEIGVIQDLAAISKLVHASGAYFHTDAVQAVPYLKIDIKKLNIDYLTISAHKFHGPLGVGAVFINRKIKIKALISGGGQENNLRSGTYNVPGIVGLTEALLLSYKERGEYLKKVKALRNYLWQRIKKEIPDVVLNGDFVKRTPNNLNILFRRIEGEAILMDLSFKGICVSTGSACSAVNLKVSSVLRSIGLVEDNLNSNIRFTLGKYNTKKEIDYTIKCLKDTVKRLRAFTPIK
ncbi:MAG: cysteine desulfurase family protein [Candidatus Falkowbacteria bacterium]